MRARNIQQLLTALALCTATNLAAAMGVEDLDVTITVIQSESGDASTITREISLPDAGERVRAGEHHHVGGDTTAGRGDKPQTPPADSGKMDGDGDAADYRRASKEARDRARESHGEMESADESARENLDHSEDAHDATGDASSDSMTEGSATGGGDGAMHDTAPDSGGTTDTMKDIGGSTTTDHQHQGGTDGMAP